MRQLWNRFRGWIAGRRDIAEEVESHLEMEIEARIEGGMTPEEARADAHRHFGNPALITEGARETWGFRSLDSLGQDIRYGLRAMRRAPAFSAVVILTLALGVGINVAIFSVVRAVLLKPLPYPQSERLVWLGEQRGISVTWVNFQHWREDNHTFEEMAAYQGSGMTLTGRGEPVIMQGRQVTTPYFALLGMHPLLGRFFSDSEDRPGAAQLIVLDYSFWSARLGGDPHIVGQPLALNGRSYEVIGVAAPVWQPGRVDYYLPLGQSAGGTLNRAKHGSIRGLGRLKPGITLAAASADLDAIMRHLAEVDPGPENKHHSFGRFLAEDITGDVRSVLLILMGAAALILLIACANIASLLLARNTARASELALRKAIGAGRMRIVRQLLTENVVLAGTGGLAGIFFAWWALKALIAMAPRNIPRLAETALDLPVFLFACAITIAAGLAAGLAPVIATGKLDLTAVLKEGGHMAGGGKRRQMLRNALVAGEVALTFVLTFGSGILLRSLIAAQNASPGFDPERVVSFTLQLPGSSYKTPETVAGFYDRLLQGLRTLPGVTGASAVHCAPGAGDCGDWFYSIPGRPIPAQNDVPLSLFNSAEPGYFQVMRIPIREGREFDSRERVKGANAAIVNQTLARRWWPNEPAIGHQIKVGGPYMEGGIIEIIGVAGDVKQFARDTEPMPEIYLPASARSDNGMMLMVRTAGDPEALMRAVRATVGALDRNLPVQNLGTLEQALGAGLDRRRFSALLLTMFAGLAMALAAIGIYGLLSYWVSVREPEIAIRLAIGARPVVILRWTTLHALRLAAIGIAFGALGAWEAARGLESMVYGVPPRSPATMIAAALAVALLAFAAAFIPAWRASRVDAARRLHYV